MKKSSNTLFGLLPLAFFIHNSNLLGVTQPYQNLSEPTKLRLSGAIVRPTLVDAPLGFIGSMFVGSGVVQVDQLTGAPRVMTGKLLDSVLESSDITEDSLLKLADEFFKLNASTLGVKREQLMLDRQAMLIDKDVQFLKFRLLIDGIPLVDGSIDLHFKRGQLVQVVNYSFSEVAGPTSFTLQNTTAPTLDEVRSLIARDAADLLIVDQVREKNRLWRIRAEDRTYQKVMVQRYVVTDQMGREFFFDLDLEKRQFLAIIPQQVFYAEDEIGTEPQTAGRVKADFYPRWYQEKIEQIGVPKVSVTTENGVVTTNGEGAFSTSGTAAPKIAGMRGAQVLVKATTGAALNLAGTLEDNRWQITYTKGAAPIFSDKQMAQTMAYLHTQKIITYASQYIQTPWLQRPLNVNVNLSQTCNAYWDGKSTNFYSAGGKCANTALIADVMYHEWGHGLDANTGGIEDGAYSEGFGDIVSILMTQSNILGIGFFTDGKPVRDLEPNKVYPRDRGEVHAEGLIIGGTFWDLFKSLKVKYDAEKATDLLSQYALKSVFTASRYTDVYKALLVIDDNDSDPTNGTPNLCEINQAFTDHGLAKKDASCAEIGQDI